MEWYFFSRINSQTDLHYCKGRKDMSKSSSKNKHSSASSMVSTAQTSSEILQTTELKSFCFSEIKEATCNFSLDNELGNGEFGCVFKGWIDEQSLKAARPKTGMVIAVKVLYQTTCQNQQEWLAEIECLGQLCHPNLVKLIGFCIENDHQLLIYEFMPNGNLTNHLFRFRDYFPKHLFMKVAISAARGLAYLHDEAHVMYGDFKASNILLDSDYNAKLDFGFAKDRPKGGKSHATAGFVAPEYISKGEITAKSDVYNFGIVLIEMIIGSEVQDRLEWARGFFQFFNPAKLGRLYWKSSLAQVAQLAYQCTSKEPDLRPNMKYVVQYLQEVQDFSDKKGYKRPKFHKIKKWFCSRKNSQ